MSKILKEAYNSEEFRKKGHELVDVIADHLKDCYSKKINTVIDYKDPDELYKKWKDELTENKFGKSEALWKEIIKDSIRIHNPNYMGHQVSAPAPISGIAEMLNGCLNNGSAIYEMGPVSTAMERVVIKWLVKEIGMGAGSGGIMTDGGSLGNMTALLAAGQNISTYNYWKEGLREDFKPAVLISNEAHYSLARAVQILGWGEDAIIKVPVDENLSVKPEYLEPLYKKAAQDGFTVIAVIGNACSTSTGAYDPLNEIANFCEEKKIWFHVDGAHGGAAAISPKYKHLTYGIERADSITIDFHKMMGVSALTTALLFKNENISYNTFEQDAAYILNSKTPGQWYNSAKRTFECTKNMMALKVYLTIKTYGPEFMSDYITKCYDNGIMFGEIINSQDDFETAVNPTTNIVCFRYITKCHSSLEPDELNKKIREKILKDGEFYIVQTTIRNKTYLRTSLMNPFTGETEMNNLLSRIRDIVNEIS